MRKLSNLRNIQTFSSFKNSLYRIYYGGMLGQMTSMNMQMIARSLLIYRMTDSAAILGGLSLATALPMLFLSLFGGVIADRVQKKYVMIVGQSLSALVSLSVAILLTLGFISVDKPDSWWILALTSVCQGTIMGLMMPSRQAILPEIVSDDELMNAISLNMTGMNALRLFAPAISGFLIDSVGFAAVYYVTTSAYIIAVIFISFLPLTSTMTIRGGGALSQIKEGLQYIRGETTILLVLLLTLVGVVLSHPFTQLMPVFTETVLKVGASELGILMSVSGGGAIVGSIILASLPNRKRGLMMLIGLIILGVSLALFSFSESWILSLGLIAVVGLGQTVMMALSNTIIQYYVEDDYRGRVMSILMMQMGMTSFSTFLAGVLIEGIGAQWAIGGLALLLLFLAVAAIIFLPRIRNLD
ncbi:MFS transporter [Chloroflexota bacterium]